MNITNELITVTITFLTVFLGFRTIFLCICEHLLKNGERKKRKRGQSFLEWLLYSRFKNEIPIVLLYLYYCIAIVHCILYFFILLVYICNRYITIVKSVTMKIIIIDIIFAIILNIAFYSPKRGEYNVARWIKNKKKN